MVIVIVQVFLASPVKYRSDSIQSKIIYFFIRKVAIQNALQA